MVYPNDSTDPNDPRINRPPPQTPQNPNALGDAPWQGWEQWTSLWDSMRGGQDPRSALTDIMSGFEGGHQRDLGFFLEHPAWKHMMAFSLKDSPAWKNMEGMRFPKEQMISSGMGQIGAAGRQAVDQGMAALQQSGMGRSPGAAASVSRSARVAAGQSGAQLTAGVGEQAFKGELARLSNMLATEQAMQQIALGISPDRSKPSNQTTGGDWMELLGALAGAGATLAAGAGAACYVARAAYGEDNPRWKLFRIWLTLRAPAWFRKLYIRHGERVARWIQRWPCLKRPIRAWMDRRIASLRRPRCAKT